MSYPSEIGSTERLRGVNEISSSWPFVKTNVNTWTCFREATNCCLSLIEMNKVATAEFFIFVKSLT